MIRRHTPFVPPQHLHSRPHHLGYESLRAQPEIGVTRRRPAGERDDELATRGNRVPCGRDETCRARVGERGGAGQHREIGSHRPSALLPSRINGRRCSRRPCHCDSTTSLLLVPPRGDARAGGLHRELLGLPRRRRRHIDGVGRHDLTLRSTNSNTSLYGAFGRSRGFVTIPRTSRPVSVESNWLTATSPTSSESPSL